MKLAFGLTSLRPWLRAPHAYGVGPPVRPRNNIAGWARCCCARSITMLPSLTRCCAQRIGLRSTSQRRSAPGCAPPTPLAFGPRSDLATTLQVGRDAAALGPSPCCLRSRGAAPTYWATLNFSAARCWVIAFHFENAGFYFDAVCVLVECTVCVDDAVAWIEQRHGVAGHGSADGACCSGLSD